MNPAPKFLVAAALLTALPAAAAAQAGTAVTAESGGQQAGCVEWSYTTVPNPTSRAPQRVNVVFTYHNRCNREVSVQLRSQSAAVNQGISRDGDVTLGPGASYSPRNPYRNYIIFDPVRDRYLKFWVLQSDQRFSIANGNLLDMHRCIPGFKPLRGREAQYPPCPSSNSYR